MRGLLCGTKARNNEEFKLQMKRQTKWWGLAGVLGILTLLAGFAACHYWAPGESSHMLGVLTGMGTGITVGSIVVIIRNRRIMGNEEKLKEARLELSDERLQDIAGRAARTAALAMIAAAYIVCLGGGIFYPVLVKVLLILMAVFLLTYVAAYRIYQKKL